MESTLEKETLDDHLKDLAGTLFPLAVESRVHSQAYAKFILGVGKENMASMKDMFEKAPGQSFTAEQREALEIQRTDADRKRVLSTFIQVPALCRPRVSMLRTRV